MFQYRSKTAYEATAVPEPTHGQRTRVRPAFTPLVAGIGHNNCKAAIDTLVDEHTSEEGSLR